jgi:hypothetical protein
LVFYPYEKDSVTKLFIFICNLKSNNRGNSEDQLNSGKILGSFLAENAIRCYNLENQSISGFIKTDEKYIKYIKILFSDCRPLPRTTKQVIERKFSKNNLT